MICRNPFYFNRHKSGPGLVDYKRFKSLPPEIRNRVTPLPCGRCVECRIQKARCWATRILLEASQFSDNTFATLTFEDDKIPLDWCVDKRDFQLFMKRLRKIKGDDRIRYFAVGEYGEDGHRPHYHVIIFNHPYSDEDTIQSAWNKGFIQNGEVTVESARYVTEYCVKKWTTNSWDRPDDLSPEFMLSSRGEPGGVGASALEELSSSLRSIYRVNQNNPYRGPPITSIRFGGKNHPLDKYMQLKLYKLLFVEKETMRKYLYDSQERIFQRHLTDDYQFDMRSVAISNRKISDRKQRKNRKLKNRRVL